MWMLRHDAGGGRDTTLCGLTIYIALSMGILCYHTWHLKHSHDTIFFQKPPLKPESQV